MFKPKYIFFFLFILLLPGCATKLSEAYECEIFKPWQATLKDLNEKANLRYGGEDKLIPVLAPAFNDEVFKVTFGTSYKDLTKKQGAQIWRSMYACDPTSFAAVVSGALRSDGFNPKRKLLWEREIEIASKTPFNTIVNTRQQKDEKYKLAVNLAKKQRRIAINRRQELQNKKFNQFRENIKNLYQHAFPEETKDVANNYADYGECAPKLLRRLTRCSVGRGDCDSNGCSKNATSCQHGFPGYSCTYILNLTAKKHGIYYCDIDNPRRYNIERKTIINDICSKQ